MFYCDYHIHTKYSFDGAPEATVEGICESAIQKGISHIAFTDHFEANAGAQGLYSPYDVKSAYGDIMQAKEKYRGKLDITYGLEIGQANQYPDVANAILRDYPVEFVLASLHNLRGKEDFYFMDFKSMGIGAAYSLYGEYLREIHEIISSLDKITSIGHITYPHRYMAQAGMDFDFSRFYGELSDIFKIMEKKDIALEINTSTYAKGLGFCMPDCDILSLYRDCGGRLITVGSDAHSPKNLCAGYEYGVECAKKSGFDSVLIMHNGQKDIRRFN